MFGGPQIASLHDNHWRVFAIALANPILRTSLGIVTEHLQTAKNLPLKIDKPHFVAPPNETGRAGLLQVVLALIGPAEEAADNFARLSAVERRSQHKLLLEQCKALDLPDFLAPFLKVNKCSLGFMVVNKHELLDLLMLIVENDEQPFVGDGRNHGVEHLERRLSDQVRVFREPLGRGDHPKQCEKADETVYNMARAYQAARLLAKSIQARLILLSCVLVGMAVY